MKKRILFTIIAILILLPAVFSGCQSGIAKETYDKVVSEVKEFQAKYTDALTKYDELKAEKTAVDTELREAQAKNAELESQVNALKAQYDLTGATPQETAEKIVKYYHETHIYSAYDLFVCSDMAAEVWNMLKAAGINSIIAVGNKDTPINDILLSNHAWVLAEVKTGYYLALETTGGHSVSVTQNPLYYSGWSFDSPADLKNYNDLIKEYNVRVGVRNNINSEVVKYMNLYNNSSSQTEADKYMEVYNELTKLRTEQETILDNLMTQISSLAAVIT